MFTALLEEPCSIFDDPVGKSGRLSKGKEGDRIKLTKESKRRDGVLPLCPLHRVPVLWRNGRVRGDLFL